MDLDRIRSILDGLKEKGSQVYGAAADKTKDAARIARLSVAIGQEKETLKKTYIELGKAYYEENRSTAEGVLAELCGELDAARERIGRMQQEIDALRGSVLAGGQDFDAVVSESEEPDIEVEIVEEDEDFASTVDSFEEKA